MENTPNLSLRAKPRRRLRNIALAGLVYLALLGASMFRYSRERAAFSVVCGQASKIDFAVAEWAFVHGKRHNDEVLPTNGWLTYFIGLRENVHGEVFEPPLRVGEPARVRLTRRLLAYPRGTRISWLKRDGAWVSIAPPQGPPMHYGKTNGDLPYSRDVILPWVPFAWMFLQPIPMD